MDEITSSSPLIPPSRERIDLEEGPSEGYSRRERARRERGLLPNLDRYSFMDEITSSSPLTPPSRERIDLEEGPSEGYYRRERARRERGLLPNLDRYSFVDEITSSSPPIPPSRERIDLEAGPSDQIQCRICLETDGKDFIAPCRCKGTSKFVHRACLNHWRAVKEGFAFAHCTTCKAPYRLSVRILADGRWRTLKFYFFVTRDIIFIFVAVQLLIVSLAYLVCGIDICEKYWLWLSWGFIGKHVFYYICGAVLFFALLGLFGCFMTCFYQAVSSDPCQPCRELCLCCCQPGMCDDHRMPGGNLYTCTECVRCCESCASCAGECSCSGDGDDSGLPFVVIVGLVVLALFTAFGIFYGVLVAMMVGQRIWQRHYHILVKKMLTKDYIVEDVDGEITDSNWCPPPLPSEHVQHLKTLDLL